jgi:5-methylcytosine-specific restriction endonuclease McrA
MWQRRVRPQRRKDGVATIRRETYSTVNGFTKKDGWWTIRKKVEERSGNRCEARKNGVRCNAPGNEVHHIIALSKGGTNSMSNLLMLCRDCHDRRHNHLHRSR